MTRKDPRRMAAIKDQTPGEGNPGPAAASPHLRPVPQLLDLSAEQSDALAEGLCRVVAFTDDLTGCQSLDELFRRSVEFAVRSLGVERCSIFLEEDGHNMRGTYGVNLQGEIVCEGEGLIPVSQDLRDLFVSDKLSDRLWHLSEGEHTEWAGNGYRPVQSGWIVTTPIHSARRLLGVMFNDCALSGRPVDSPTQRLLALFCSLLGGLLVRKRAEQALRSSEERLSAILRDMEEVVWSLDARTLFPVFLSPHVEKVFGRSLYEFFEDPHLWHDIIHPQDKAEADRFHRQLTSQPRASVTYRILRPDGEERWISLWGRRRTGPEGGDEVMEGIASDVTERRQAEDASRVMARRNESLISALGEIVYEHSIAGGDFQWEGATLRSLGYEPEELGDNVSSWLRRVHPEDRERVLDQLSWAFDNGAPYDVQYRFQTKGGEYRWVHDRGVPHYNAAGERDRIIGVMTNIHERKESEVRQHRLEQRMQQTEKLESLGLMAAGVAHDFNNLVGGILGNVSLALEDLRARKDIAGAVQSLEIIRRTGERAAELTRQLLVLSGKSHATLVLVNLSSLVHDMLEMLRPSLGRDVELRSVLSPDIMSVRADPTQVRQIVLNLVSNANDALAATGGGEITVRTGMTRINPLNMTETFVGSSLRAGDFAYLEVNDNGCGIPEEVKARIFDPFFSTKRRGHGLGLASVLGIARAHGGAVSVRSEPGRFTRFTVLLPAAPLDPEAKGKTRLP